MEKSPHVFPTHYYFWFPFCPPEYLKQISPKYMKKDKTNVRSEDASIFFNMRLKTNFHVAVAKM